MDQNHHHHLFGQDSLFTLLKITSFASIKTTFHLFNGFDRKSGLSSSHAFARPLDSYRLQQLKEPETVKPSSTSQRKIPQAHSWKASLARRTLGELISDADSLFAAFVQDHLAQKGYLSICELTGCFYDSKEPSATADFDCGLDLDLKRNMSGLMKVAAVCSCGCAACCTVVKA